MRVELFLLDADGPALKFDFGHKSHFECTYLDAHGQRRFASGEQRLTQVEQWLVPGMRVPGIVDPSEPEKAEVILDEVPPLSQRLLADDPALAGHPDLYFEIRRLRTERLHSLADQVTAGPGFDSEVQAQLRSFEQADQEEDLAEFMASRPQQPVIDDQGRLRGTADLISTQRKPPGRPGEGGGPNRLKRIYRVWLYGYGPYAVLDTAWIGAPSSRGALAYGRVPVSVSQSDRNDVLFHWDEYDRDPGEVLHKRVMKDMDRAMRDADHVAAQGLEQVFAAVDPGQRRMLAEQTKAMGTHVPDHLYRDTARMAKLQTLLERRVISPEEHDHYLTKL